MQNGSERGKVEAPAFVCPVGFLQAARQERDGGSRYRAKRPN